MSVFIVYTNDKTQNVYYNQSKYQAISLFSGALIFITAGMNLAFSVGWSLFTNLPSTMQLQFSWFIGVIAGAIVAAPLITNLGKQKFMLLSTFLVTVGGIIYTSAPFIYAAVLTARYMNGVGIGFAIVPFLVHASEIAAETNRHFCLWLEQVGVSLGVMTQVILSSQWSETNFSVLRVHGIISIMLGLISLVCTSSIIESPIFHIRKYEDDEALECLKLLQRPTVVSEDNLMLAFEERKNYVFENENLSMQDSFAQGFWALVRLVIYRSLVAFSFSLPLNDAMIMATFIVMDNRLYGWPPILFACLRVLGTFFGGYMYDISGRKQVSLFALAFMSALAIVIGVVFNEGLPTRNCDYMSAVTIVSFVFQYCAGVFIPSSSDCLAEAFPMLIKPYFIAVCVIVQQTIHIVVICVYQYSGPSIAVYGICVGVIGIVSTFAFAAVLPETSNCTLKEAQYRFRRWR